MRTALKIPALHSILLAGVLLIGAGPFAPAEAAEREPIAYIGHGAMFDQDGKEMAPTAAFIRDAQTWYRNYLVPKLTRAQRTEFEKRASRLTNGLALDEQSRLVLDAHLLDWLIKTAKTPDRNRLLGKNNLMKFYLKTKLPETPDATLPRSLERFNVHPELAKRLATESKAPASGPPVALTQTGTGGAAYRALCLANGVPIPPDIGTSGWVSRGVIPKIDLFIATSMDAEVMTFQSASPVGMCIALPRFDAGNTVQLDGVICLGQVSSKVCFWDNEKNGVVNTFQRGSVVPFANFGGGTELIGNVGGVCSDCHAGENPYVIHGTVLNGLANAGLPTFPNSWHDPIVRNGDTVPWPENPGPMKAPPVPLACSGCHTQGLAGRFPHLSTALPGYCNAVLGNSIVKTMPPGNAGSLQNDPAVVAFKNWCGVPSNGSTSDRGDPHITTFNGVNYDFQSAGEFVALRHADGTEIQTRQTPVATAADPGPNPHTGLASCVSVNTAVAARVGKYRVTYQPPLGRGQDAGLQLRVNGKLTTVGSAGLNLGGGGRIVKSAVGGGIEVFFPNNTRLIAVPNFWGPPHNIWYLNVDVVNTPAREGVMGALLAGNWLPTLPDGTPLGPMPASLHQRHLDLNQKFADAWRVTNGTSLFDYAPGTSTMTFTDPNWPPEKPPCTIAGSTIPPARPMEAAKAEALCAKIVDKDMKAQCVFDTMITGEAGFAKAYLVTQQLRGKANR
jgi:hypothetical protein